MELKKKIGFVIYEMIARHLPASASHLNIGQIRFRAFCARLIMSQCGSNVNIDRNVTFSTRCSIGNNSGIGANSLIGITVHIGNDVMMGQDCIILTRNHRFDDVNTPMIKQGYAEEKPITIGDDVWIGSRVIILGGVTIGSHCVIGAGSVVTHDVRDYEIVAGNPAKVIRNRLSDRVNNTAPGGIQ